ncbi:MAG: glycosyltransferase family 2 protein [Methylocystis silviterrae]|uniref:glycosyltransferase family 2 protein n=1 Tax=Methylocystis silviterrae TaxID=2743612 RepID=UPI003C70F774
MNNAVAPGDLSIGVVIPVKNEAAALPVVLSAIPDWVKIVVVADGQSSDGSGKIARDLGAVVVTEPRHGYGCACLTALSVMPSVDVIIFMDGDASDDPADMLALVAPIADGAADLVLGSRTLGKREAGALTPQQLFGNWLACLLMRWIWGARYTDLGPFRAIRRDALSRLALTDENYGWTVEMQARAAKHGLRTLEVPVRYRRRIGVSKVSGTLRGAIGAGVKILYVIGREALRQG